MTWRDAAVEVLRSLGRDTHINDILYEIEKRGLVTTRGRTPLNTLITQMLRASEMNYPRSTRDVLFYHDKGSWGLVEWLTPVINTPIIREDDEESFPEGKESYRLHLLRERTPKVAEIAKRRRIEKDPLLRCEVCGFSFLEAYGEKGRGFIEAHHTTPVSQLSGETETKVEDIALVCSNCHKMLHRHRPWLNITELKKLKN